MSARIFISYTGRDEISKRISQALFDRLEAEKGFLPWRDRDRLNAGEKWHEVTTKNICASHGAVIILSKKALKSEWVLKESTFLKVRYDGLPDYKVVVVLLEKLVPEDLEKKKCIFRVLHFGEDQLMQVPERVAEAEVPDEVVKALDELKEKWNSERPDDRIVRRIKVELERIPEDMLLEFARKLNVDVWFENELANKIISRELARLLPGKKLPEILSAIRSVYEYFYEESKADKILNYLLLFQLLVPRAEVLRKAVKTNQNDPKVRQNVLGLNAASEDTLKNYIYRASGDHYSWTCITVTGIFNPENMDSIVRMVREALVKQMDFSAESLDEDMQWHEDPVFVLIPGAPEEQIVQVLTEPGKVLNKPESFKNLFFLFYEEDLLYEEVKDVIQFLKPEMKEEEERDFFELRLTVNKELNRLRKLHNRRLQNIH